MIAYRTMCQYRWAHTKRDQPYVILRSKRSGLRASIMWFERDRVFVVRHFFVGPRTPRFDKQQRNEFPDLLTAWRFARSMIA